MKQKNDSKSFIELMVESLCSAFTTPFLKQDIEPIADNYSQYKKRLAEDYKRK
jgi:hypothetical protein